MATLPSRFRCGVGWRRPLAFVVSLAVGWSLTLPAAAEEVKVLTADAFRPALSAMVAVFEKRTGHKLLVVNGTPDALARRIRDGEGFELAVLPPTMLEALGKEGAVSDGSIIPLARVLAGPAASVYAGALSSSASDSRAALSLLILLASEETQLILKDKGMAAP